MGKMKTPKVITSKIIIVAAVVIGLFGLNASAQLRQASQANSQGVRLLIQRIQNRTELFRDSLDLALERNARSTRYDENLKSYVSDFENSLTQFRQRLDEGQATTGDAQDVLSRATSIDNSLRRQTLDSRTQRYWTNVRT